MRVGPPCWSMGRVRCGFAYESTDQWTVDLRANPAIRVLVSNDPSSFPLGTGPKQQEIGRDGDYPAVWTNSRYRMIYFNMGHNDLGCESPAPRELPHTFGNEAQDRMVLNALAWLGAGNPAPTSAAR